MFRLLDKKLFTSVTGVSMRKKKCGGVPQSLKTLKS